MGYFEKIFSGIPFLIEEKQLSYMTPDNRLFQPPHFFLTTLERLAEISIIAMQRGIMCGMVMTGIPSMERFRKKLS